MAQLIYTAITSLDGYVSDAAGKFGWAAPDAEVHAFVNELERPIGTYLYGRRLYEVMRYWASAHEQPGLSAVEQQYTRIWQAAEKVVYSRTLSAVSTPKTQLERNFDLPAIARMKAAAERDISVGGAELAGQAIAAGLVDECHLFLHPILVGGGQRSLPGGVHWKLALCDERRFGCGVIYLRYRSSARG